MKKVVFLFISILIIMLSSCIVSVAEKEETKDAAVPEITEQPKDTSVFVSEKVTLSVSAKSTDGGTISYQWYKQAEKEETEANKAEELQDENKNVLEFIAEETSVNYYYCLITNTNTDKSINGKTSAFVKSSVVKVRIEEKNIPDDSADDPSDKQSDDPENNPSSDEPEDNTLGEPEDNTLGEPKDNTSDDPENNQSDDPAEDTPEEPPYVPKIVNYRVEYYQQNIADDEYTVLLNETKTLSGTEGELTDAEEKTYGGFEILPFAQKEIAGDGSTVVKIFYNRKIITLSFNLDGGQTSTVLKDSRLTGKYGAAVNIADPVKQGSLFLGWDKSIPEIFTADDSFTAQWTTSSVKVTVLPESEITVSFTNSGTLYSFTAEEGFESYSWEVDGKSQNCTANVFEIETNNLISGIYTVTVYGFKNGILYSAVIQISK